MISKRLLNILFAKLSLATFFVGSYFTYRNYHIITRTINSMQYKNIQAEEGYFKDPEGLEVNIAVTLDKKKQVFLCHKPSETKISIQEDLFPPTESMLEIILQRALAGKLNTNNFKPYLQKLNEIEKKIYDSI